MRYAVHLGYDRNGRERNRYFATLQEASDFCGVVFRRTGKVLTIVAA